MTAATIEKSKCLACGRPKCKGRERTCSACRKRAQRERERLDEIRTEMQAPEVVLEERAPSDAFDLSPTVWAWVMETDCDGLSYALPRKRRHRQWENVEPEAGQLAAIGDGAPR